MNEQATENYYGNQLIYELFKSRTAVNWPYVGRYERIRPESFVAGFDMKILDNAPRVGYSGFGDYGLAVKASGCDPGDAGSTPASHPSGEIRLQCGEFV